MNVFLILIIATGALVVKYLEYTHETKHNPTYKPNFIEWLLKSRTERRRDYYRNVYLKSDAWKRKRHVVLKRDNWTCVYCGRRPHKYTIKDMPRGILVKNLLIGLCQSVKPVMRSGINDLFKKSTKILMPIIIYQFSSIISYSTISPTHSPPSPPPPYKTPKALSSYQTMPAPYSPAHS